MGAQTYTDSETSALIVAASRMFEGVSAVCANLSAA